MSGTSRRCLWTILLTNPLTSSPVWGFLALQNLRSNIWTSLQRGREQFPVNEKFCLDAYTKEEVLFFIGQIFEAREPLRNIEQQHKDQLFCSLRSHAIALPGSDVNRSGIGQNILDRNNVSRLDHPGHLCTIRNGCIIAALDGCTEAYETGHCLPIPNRTGHENFCADSLSEGGTTSVWAPWRS